MEQCHMPQNVKPKLVCNAIPRRAFIQIHKNQQEYTHKT